MIRLLPLLFLTACLSVKPAWRMEPLLPEPTPEELKQQIEERKILNELFL
jgi:hypothetical protein